MINELFLYGHDASLFKDLVIQSSILDGRYHVSPNYGHDLNTNNLEMYLKDPAYGLSDVKQKYPICVCITPRSRVIRIHGARWEQFFFTLYFLQRTYHDSQNKIKSRDPDTNTSSHYVWMDWSEMKTEAMQFMDLLETTLQGNATIDNDVVRFNAIVNLDTETIGIRRLSNFNNDKVSGVEISFAMLLNITACLTGDDITFETACTSFWEEAEW